MLTRCMLIIDWELSGIIKGELFYQVAELIKPHLHAVSVFFFLANYLNNSFYLGLKRWLSS